MNLLCRISQSPDSCVRQSESPILRWGGSSLIATKLVPGVSVVVAPMAAALRMPLPRLVGYAALGSALWTGRMPGQPGDAEHGKRVQATLLHQWVCSLSIQEAAVDGAAQQVLQGGPRPAVGHMVRCALCGGAQQHLHRDVSGCATAAGGVAQRLSARQFQQLVQVPGRHARLAHQHLAEGEQLRDRHQIFCRPEAKLPEHVRVDRQQRVLVGGTRHLAHSNVAAGAGLVVHDHRLAQRLLQLRRDQPRHQVDR
jgi:hypothetical protein